MLGTGLDLAHFVPLDDVVRRRESRLRAGATGTPATSQRCRYTAPPRSEPVPSEPETMYRSFRSSPPKHTLVHIGCGISTKSVRLTIGREHRDAMSLARERNPDAPVDRHDETVGNALLGAREQLLLAERSVGRDAVAEHAAAAAVGVIQRASIGRKPETVGQLHVAPDDAGRAVEIDQIQIAGLRLYGHRRTPGSSRASRRRCAPSRRW